jgi:predicted Zn-dependent protease
MRLRAPLTIVCTAFAAIALSPGRASLAQETPVLAAMADELARSMSSLQLRDQPPPYFIEYEVEERAATLVSAQLGAVVENLTGKSRVLRVGVRVGDYSFDNSLFTAPNTGGGVVSLTADGRITAPLDDTYDAMRRQIWLATDAAYKRAVSVYARKRSAFQNRNRDTEVPDFSKEEPQRTELQGLPLEFTNRAWPERAAQISAAVAGIREIESSAVQVSDSRGTRYYLNSEGSRVIAPIQQAMVRVSAETRAPDGSVLRDAFSVVEKTLEEMPPVSELVDRTRTMAERLRDLRSAPVGEEYAGPVLVEGRASAELVAQALVPALLARRPNETVGRGGRGGGGGGGGGGRGGQVTPFHRRIGLRVLTESFSVRDTPSLREFQGRPVAGSYVVDSEGVRATDVSLVEKGRLLTLLTGRAPLRGLTHSTGHTRGGDVHASVLQLESNQAVSAADLRRQYLELLETQDSDFGYIIRSIANPNDVQGGGGLILEAVKVTPDGRETPVRGIRLSGAAASAFRDIVEGSRERTLLSMRVTNNDAMTVIAPNLLFEELEIVHDREVTQNPPAVPSPL